MIVALRCVVLCCFLLCCVVLSFMVAFCLIGCTVHSKFPQTSSYYCLSIQAVVFMILRRQSMLQNVVSMVIIVNDNRQSSIFVELEQRSDHQNKHVIDTTQFLVPCFLSWSQPLVAHFLLPSTTSSTSTSRLEVLLLFL